MENLKKINDEQQNTILILKTDLEYYKKRVYDDDSLFASNNINLESNIEIEYKQIIEAMKIEINKFKSDIAKYQYEINELVNKNLFLSEQNAELINSSKTIELVAKSEEENNFPKKNNEDIENKIADKLEGLLSKLEKKI